MEHLEISQKNKNKIFKKKCYVFTLNWEEGNKTSTI